MPEDVLRLRADAAHDTGELRARPEARGIGPVIAHDRRGRGPARWQRGMKLAVRCVRSGIEPVFEPLKRSRGLARARSSTPARNPTDITFRVLAFHLCDATTPADAG